jgi:hypothetical protein
MRAFLSSAIERFFSLFVYANELSLMMRRYIHPHGWRPQMGWPLTSPVLGGASLSISFAPPRPIANRLSGHVNHCFRGRPPSMVIAMRARRLLPIVRSVRTTSAPISTYSL